MTRVGSERHSKKKKNKGIETMIDKTIKMPLFISFGSSVVTSDVSVAIATKDKATIHEIFVLIIH